MTKEKLLHRQALEDGGWLKNGTILQYWDADEQGYPRSYYVVAFPRKSTKETHSGAVIYCFRVFGGLTKETAGIDIPVNISADQVAHIFPDGYGIKFQNNPNWEPAEGYKR